jgi:hypothetical protein
MQLDNWAMRWKIPGEAMGELRIIFGLENIGLPSVKPGVSESAVQSDIRLEASEKGARLWRNNVGATYARDGTFLRYGLANESTGVNREIKSADLIGIRPIVIAPSMVGWTIGQFVSREVKKADWQYKGTDREIAQLRWAQLIVSLGGDACFTNGRGTL